MTAAPSASSAPATVPPVALTGEFGPFDQSLHSAFIGHGALAISVAVAKDGELVHTAAFGVANPMTGEAVSPAHRFRVASNSKLLTATAVLELVEDGKLGLDEPVLGPLVSRLGVTRPIPDLGHHAAPTAEPHVRVPGVPAHVLRRRGRELCGGGTARTRRCAARTARDRLPLQQHELLPDRSAHRGGHGSSVRDRDPRGRPAPLGISDMRMAGTYDVRPGDVVHPTTPGRTFMEALGGAGADRDGVGPGDHRRRPGPHPARLASLVGVHGRPDATAPGRHPVLERAVVRARPAGLGRRHLGAHGHGRERPVHGHPPPGRHHLGGDDQWQRRRTPTASGYVDEAFATIGIAARR